MELIEIDGDPIEHHKKANAYSCHFDVRLASDCGYPTPAGATWLDFSFHELPDGRILVGVTEERRFRARDYRVNRGRATDEVAEHSTSMARLYSLEELGLRTQAGKLSPEGEALIDLLRSHGRLMRRGDDVAVLKLGKILREWAGLDMDPLQFGEASRVWTTLFACSSEIRGTLSEFANRRRTDPRT